MSATITETEQFDLPATTVFDYVVDFTNLAEWDPTFDESVRLDDGALGVGARFRVTAEKAGTEITIDYRIEEYDRPRAAKLVGTADNFMSIDEVEVREVDGGSELTWTATVDADVPVLDTLATPLFKLVGKAAMAGLRSELGT